MRSSPENARILTYLNASWNGQNISVTILAHASRNKHDVLTLFMVRMFFILSSDKSSGCSMLTSNTHFIHTLLLQLFPSMLSCSWFGVRKGRRYAPQIPVHAMVASASVQLQVWTQKWLLVSWYATGCVLCNLYWVVRSIQTCLHDHSHILYAQPWPHAINQQPTGRQKKRTRG